MSLSAVEVCITSKIVSVIGSANLNVKFAVNRVEVSEVTFTAVIVGSPLSHIVEH